MIQNERKGGFKIQLGLPQHGGRRWAAAAAPSLTRFLPSDSVASSAQKQATSTARGLLIPSFMGEHAC